MNRLEVLTEGWIKVNAMTQDMVRPTIHDSGEQTATGVRLMTSCQLLHCNRIITHSPYQDHQ